MTLFWKAFSIEPSIQRLCLSQKNIFLAKNVQTRVLYFPLSSATLQSPLHSTLASKFSHFPPKSGSEMTDGLNPLNVRNHLLTICKHFLRPINDINYLKISQETYPLTRLRLIKILLIQICVKNFKCPSQLFLSAFTARR